MTLHSTGIRRGIRLAVLLAAGGLSMPAVAAAHCDTLDGPVVVDARIALEKSNVTPVLKWVRKEDETAIRAAFAEALALRSKGAEAKVLADRYFFETLVRAHRAAEGAPYVGLKSAGEALGPAVSGSDKALESGSVDALVKLVVDKTAAGIRERFQHAVERKKHANESVEAGREFVAAYVEFMHYTERLYDDAARFSGHDSHAIHAEGDAGKEHKHR